MNIIFRKMLSNMIDIIASLIIRLIILSIIVFIFKETITMAIEDLVLKSKNLSDSKEVIIMFLQHTTFKILLIFIIIFALIGSIYNIYFHSSTWCATIGQRILNIVTIRDNGEYLSISRAILYYILSIIPFFITVYFLLFLAINGDYLNNGISGVIKIFGANIFNITMSILMLLWINLPLLSSNKKSMADMICKTKMELGRTDSKFPKLRI